MPDKSEDDDAQVCLSFPHSDEAKALSKFEKCIKEDRLWMDGNYLKLNGNKTDFIILSSKHTLEYINTCNYHP